jgi:rhodanese-related sulfurtransferase
MEDITVQELKSKIEAQEDFILIDVREQYEYDMYNIGATLIPLGIFADSIPELLLEKDREIIIHCRSGARSGTAKNMLEAQGANNVRNVLGGMLAWQEAYEKI